MNDKRFPVPARGLLLRFLLMVCVVVAAGCGPGSDREALDRRAIDQHFSFSGAVHPVPYEPAQDDEPERPQTRGLAGARACGACHEQVYRNWHGSRHRVAFTNRLYQESHAREASRWCVNCHAPLLQQGGNVWKVADRVRPEEGISCAVCHVRGGRILAPQRPQVAAGTRPAHEYEVVPAMGTSQFCASCHQFNFPVAGKEGLRGQDFEYATLVMQDTFLEWRSSSFAASGGCATCHLKPYSGESHRFPGGHDLKALAAALRVVGTRLPDGMARVSVVSIGIGHAFPTGDLFRALRLRLVDGRGRIRHEFILARSFENIPRRERRPGGAAKRLVRDTTIPPPQGDIAAARSFEFAPRAGERLRYELHIDYLHAVNRLVTTLAPEETMPLISSGPLLLKDLPKRPLRGQAHRSANRVRQPATDPGALK